MCVALDGNAKLAPQPEVGDLEGRVGVGGLVDQQVLRLEVAMHHAVLVAMRGAFEQLVHEALWCGDVQPHKDAARRALMSGLGSGCAGPLPLRSINRLRSVLRYSNTR